MLGGRWRWWWLAASAMLLAIGGVVTWQMWGRVSAGPFDPVNAVIATAVLAGTVAGLRFAVRGLRQAETDAVAVAARLAVAVRRTEERARRQLLGGSDRVIDVEFRFRAASGFNAEGSAAAGTLKEVVRYYRRLWPRRLVITGAPGSGKTVLAIELILGLLEGRESEDAVPVRLSAAALETAEWSEDLVERWIADHLVRAYQLSREAAAAVVAARMVLPVLDGLDEMDLGQEPRYWSRAGHAIRACNAYLDGSGKAAIALTCRTEQYKALADAHEWIHDAAQVELLPVGPSRARAFLAGRTGYRDRWRPVLDAIARPGDVLAAELSSPWRLTLAAVVYESREPVSGRYLRDPADLADPALATPEAVRDHLLGLFIPASLEARPGRYSKEQAERWLTVLATYLDANAVGSGRVIAERQLSGTDLILHELWPVAGSRSPRAATAALMAVIWAGFLAWMLTQVPIGFSLRQVYGASAGIAVAASLVWQASAAWPSPDLIRFGQLRTRRGRRRLAAGMAAAPVAGLVGALAAGLVSGLVLDLAGGLSSGLAFGVVVGLVVWLAFGLASGLAADLREYSATRPQEIVRANLAFGTVIGLTAGAVGGTAFGFAVRITSSHEAALKFGLALGLAVALAVALLAGLAGWRYVMLLLCIWRPGPSLLPLRLARFLDWCHDAGLLRLAGIGYQFRHRELQDYLARNSRPPSAESYAQDPIPMSAAPNPHADAAHNPVQRKEDSLCSAEHNEPG